jgi:quercetin dioxygenase-like cupin family protein
MDVIRIPPKSQQAPAERFTGTVWIDQVAVGAPPSRIRANHVHFTPRSRTAWHQHPYGQILHVIAGVGRVQQRGGPVQEIRAGDTVITAAGEWHWHGAGPDNFMTHLGVLEASDDGSDANWGEHVTDDQYHAVSAVTDA